MLAWQIALIVIAVVLCIRPVILIVGYLGLGVLRIISHFKCKNIMKRMNKKN